MRKKKPDSMQTIEQAIGKFLEESHLSARFQVADMKAIWDDTMGKSIASRTQSLWFKDGKLVIKLQSGALKHHLLANRGKILVLMNEALKKDLVKEVVIL